MSKWVGHAGLASNSRLDLQRGETELDSHRINREFSGKWTIYKGIGVVLLLQPGVFFDLSLMITSFSLHKTASRTWFNVP